MPIAIALLISLCVAIASAGAESPPKAEELSVLSYNVHGVFRLLAKDDPGDRSATLGWLASRYDVTLLQEDFEYHDEIAAQMKSSTAHRGNGMRLDPRLLSLKLILLPFELILPHFSPPYGSGLTTFVKSNLPVASFTGEAYETCDGWLSGKANCWSTKGWLRVRVLLPGGAALDIYNTHLDAGARATSVATRRTQLDALATAVETISGESAIIIGGDFNLPYYRPGDRELILGFRKRLRLRDSGAGPELPTWRERDYILFRSSPDVMLTVLGSGEALEFVNGDYALSDHPALFAQFRVEKHVGHP